MESKNNPKQSNSCSNSECEKLIKRAAFLLEEVQHYVEPPEYDRDITQQEIYFSLMDEIELFIKNANKE
jgi:hypothetical protein